MMPWLPVSYDKKWKKIVNYSGVFDALLTDALLNHLTAFRMTFSLQS